MASMNKPIYSGITTHSPDKPSLVFVASRRQTRLTALELIALCAQDDNPRRFCHMSEEDAEAACGACVDPALRHTLAFGVGIHHAGLREADRRLVEELYGSGAIQVLVATATLAWGVNFPAHLVVVKGTEFFDGKTGRYVDMPVTDVLQMMGRAGRPQFDTSGVALILVHEPKKNFYKKFLYEPFPVESQLLRGGVLADHLAAEIVGGTIASRHDAVEYLTWTYMFRRVFQNPGYYGLEGTSDAGLREFLYGVVDAALDDLAASGAVTRGEDALGDVLAAAAAAAASALTASASSASSSGTPESEDVEARRRAVFALIGGGGGAGEGTTTTTTAAAAASAPPSAATLRSDVSFLAASPEDAVAPTRLGAIGSKYYLKHETAALFARCMPALEALTSSPSSSAEAIITAAARVLCDAPEFDELPVRHNEDVMNEELARALPWPCAAPGPHHQQQQQQQQRVAVDFKSPHVKAFLLLQARLCHAPLPIADYATDTKNLLDNALRVLNAMIDVAANDGRLGPALACMRLAQCIVQARLPSDSALRQLPGVRSAEAAVALARSLGISGVGPSSLLAIGGGRLGVGTAVQHVAAVVTPTLDATSSLPRVSPSETSLSGAAKPFVPSSVRAPGGGIVSSGGISSSSGGGVAGSQQQQQASSASAAGHIVSLRRALEGSADEAIAVLRGLPVCDVRASLLPRPLEPRASPASDAARAATVRVELTRVMPPFASADSGSSGGRGGAARYKSQSSSSAAAYTPFFSKRKEYGWWLVVSGRRGGASGTSEELLGMKHIPPISAPPSSSSSQSSSSAEHGRAAPRGGSVVHDIALVDGVNSTNNDALIGGLRVHLVSDAIMGIDQEVVVV